MNIGTKILNKILGKLNFKYTLKYTLIIPGCKGGSTYEDQ
jgi:hypothetical protein